MCDLFEFGDSPPWLKAELITSIAMSFVPRDVTTRCMALNLATRLTVINRVAEILIDFWGMTTSYIL